MSTVRARSSTGSITLSPCRTTRCAFNPDIKWHHPLNTFCSRRFNRHFGSAISPDEVIGETVTSFGKSREGIELLKVDGDYGISHAQQRGPLSCSGMVPIKHDFNARSWMRLLPTKACPKRATVGVEPDVYYFIPYKYLHTLVRRSASR